MTYGLSLSDFLKLSPVELDYFFYSKREYDKAQFESNEYLVRVINTFIHNSNPYRKSSDYIKEFKKLYKISSEMEDFEEKKQDIKLAKLSPDEYRSLQIAVAQIDNCSNSDSLSEPIAILQKYL